MECLVIISDKDIENNNIELTDSINKIYHLDVHETKTLQVYKYKSDSDKLIEHIDYEHTVMVYNNNLLIDNELFDEIEILNLSEYMDNINNIITCPFTNIFTERMMLIKNPKTIAVILNSPIILTQKLGNEIDSHDMVIRFNNGGCHPSHDVNNMGTKSTIRILNPTSINYMFKQKKIDHQYKTICCNDRNIFTVKSEKVINNIKKITERGLLKLSHCYVTSINYKKIHGRLDKIVKDHPLNPNFKIINGLAIIRVFLGITDSKMDVYGVNKYEKPWSFVTIGWPTVPVHATAYKNYDINNDIIPTKIKYPHYDREYMIILDKNNYITLK